MKTTIREEARKTVADFLHEHDDFVDRDNWYSDKSILRILSRIVLDSYLKAGYGWRDIAQAKRDGTGYLLSDGAQQYVGCWMQTEPPWVSPDFGGESVDVIANWCTLDGREIESKIIEFMELPSFDDKVDNLR